MQAYTYISKGKFELVEKPKPVLMHERDAIVKVTLASICSSDLHIKHGSVPRAVPGITVGHEMVGVVEEVGAAVTHVKPGDRVTVNVETFCGECFFCKNGYVNNCTDENGGGQFFCGPGSNGLFPRGFPGIAGLRRHARPGGRHERLEGAPVLQYGMPRRHVPWVAFPYLPFPAGL